jgi:hypothetical protein
MCKDVNGTLCGQKIQIWRCEEEYLGILAKITTLEHKVAAVPIHKKQKFIFTENQNEIIMNNIEKTPAKILEVLSHGNLHVDPLPSLKSLQWKVTGMKRKRGIGALETVEIVSDAVERYKQNDDIIVFADQLENPTDDTCFSIGFTSPALLSILVTIQNLDLWDKVIYY